MDHQSDIAQTDTLFTERKIQKRSFLHTFRKADKGATAVEFSIIAIPFIAMLFAIIETALVLFANQVIETAVADTSRLLMTGQAQTLGLSKDDFKNRLCDRLGSMFSCDAGVYVDVRNYSDFSSAQNARPVDGSGELDVSTMNQYSPGGSGAIVVVRAAYLWPVFVTQLGMNLSDQRNGKRLLVGTAVFKNEPFN
jgi:Flp pilus assembly protein TadG